MPVYIEKSGPLVGCHHSGTNKQNYSAIRPWKAEMSKMAIWYSLVSGTLRQWPLRSYHVVPNISQILSQNHSKLSQSCLRVARVVHPMIGHYWVTIENQPTPTHHHTQGMRRTTGLGQTMLHLHLHQSWAKSSPHPQSQSGPTQGVRTTIGSR